MPLFRNSILAEPSAVDDTIVRWDTTTGQDVNGVSPATLTDAGVLTLATTSSQVIVAGTTGTFVVSGVTLTPRIIATTASATEPNVAWVRDSTAATGAPTHNFFRSRAAGAVNNGDSLQTISGIGHDGTDYATGATMDMLVDEADTGTAAVGANSMGTQIRFLNSRRGGQSPGVSVRIRHSGALQLNTALTVLATPQGGCFEADTKVAYYTPEDLIRGVCLSEYAICITSISQLNSTTTEQSLFKTGGTLTLPTGWYFFDSMIGLNTMSATSGNAGFDLLGTGSATIAAPIFYQLDGSDAVVNVVAASTNTFSNAAQIAAPVVTATNAAEMYVRWQGTFRITVAGTIVPSISLTTGAAAVVIVGSHFRVRCMGASNAQTVGPWS